ncbi:MAG: class I tRNA ligase family protein, partial [bacterium]
SLLTAVATKGAAPYRAVLCHGWTVDGEGRQMHKSLGNGVAPEDIIKKYGADLIRLWAASADYRQDMRCSENIFKQLSDKYLKIRNTARYILGNLAGFDPAEALPFEELLPLDRWALAQLEALTEKCLAAYEKYEFHAVTYAIHNFCVVEMSSFYLDVLKDRLYCDKADSLSGKSARTAIWTILDALVRLLAPILSFTADEIWQELPHAAGDDGRNVLLNDMPAPHPERTLSEAEAERWRIALALRADVLKALELKRADKSIGKPLDAELTLYVAGEAAEAMEKLGDMDLAQLLIVSGVTIVPGEGEGYRGELEGLTVLAEPCAREKCVRCWIRAKTLGADPAHPELCARCAEVVWG